MSAAGRIWIGPSGWSYPDWDGIVYPRAKPRGFNALAFIGTLFNAVEVNSSFYRTPTARMTAAWPARTPPEFRFAFKLTRAFTHERAAFPDQSEVAAFRDALTSVRDAGKLGPLLIQFPWSFRFDAAARDWLLRLRDAFADCDRFVEVRHSSWASPAALSAIRESGGYCNIDQPRLRDCLPPTSHVLGSSAYVRLHGRNAAEWFREDRPAFERYNYLYADAELREWVDRLLEMRKQADDTYVFTNNHYRGQGVANALELRAALTGLRQAVPESLLATYPRLAAIARPPAERGLFD
ncbi:MAG: DUF72 domain-containing protein [Phycisphaerae bacterium]